MNKKFDISDNKPVFSTAVQNPEDLERSMFCGTQHCMTGHKNMFDKLASMTRSRAFYRTQALSSQKKEKVKISYRDGMEETQLIGNELSAQATDG